AGLRRRRLARPPARGSELRRGARDRNRSRSGRSCQAARPRRGRRCRGPGGPGSAPGRDRLDGCLRVATTELRSPGALPHALRPSRAGLPERPDDGRLLQRASILVRLPPRLSAPPRERDRPGGGSSPRCRALGGGAVAGFLLVASLVTQARMLALPDELADYRV